jgi:hypothetical protein
MISPTPARSLGRDAQAGGKAPRVSPNRRREIGRMVFWNVTAVLVAVALPILI